MRYSLILLVAAMLLSLGIRYFVDPVRLAQGSTDPARDLHELCQREPTLAPALDQADRGDVGELATWINRAEPVERQRLAFLLLRLTQKPGAENPDAELCWRYRHRFRAFINLDTGIEALDAEIDNLVAYTLVTGPEKPSAQDLALARALVPRLTRVARDSSEDAIMDTVGCVQFVAEDFAEAKESFTLANRYATEARDQRHHGMDSLYLRRLAAADHNAKAKAEGRPADYLPLPREDDVPAAAPTQTAAAPGAGPEAGKAP
jgi:hypothetical protein